MRRSRAGGRAPRRLLDLPRAWRLDFAPARDSELCLRGFRPTVALSRMRSECSRVITGARPRSRGPGGGEGSPRPCSQHKTRSRSALSSSLVMLTLFTNHTSSFMCVVTSTPPPRTNRMPTTAHAGPLGTCSPAQSRRHACHVAPTRAWGTSMQSEPSPGPYCSHIGSWPSANHDIDVTGPDPRTRTVKSAMITSGDGVLLMTRHSSPTVATRAMACALWFHDDAALRL